MANVSFTTHCVQYIALFPGALFCGTFALLIHVYFLSVLSLSAERILSVGGSCDIFFFFEGNKVTDLPGFWRGRVKGIVSRESNYSQMKKKTLQLQADGFWGSLWITFLENLKANVCRHVVLFPSPLTLFSYLLLWLAPRLPFRRPLTSVISGTILWYRRQDNKLITKNISILKAGARGKSADMSSR